MEADRSHEEAIAEKDSIINELREKLMEKDDIIKKINEKHSNDDDLSAKLIEEKNKYEKLLGAKDDVIASLSMQVKDKVKENESLSKSRTNATNEIESTMKEALKKAENLENELNELMKKYEKTVQEKNEISNELKNFKSISNELKNLKENFYGPVEIGLKQTLNAEDDQILLALKDFLKVNFTIPLSKIGQNNGIRRLISGINQIMDKRELMLTQCKSSF